MKMQKLFRVTSIILFLLGAALLIESSLKYWEGYSALEKMEVRRGRPLKIHNLISASNRLVEGEEMGSLIFPKLEASIPIFHGVSEDELKKGVGHVPLSKRPGETGNIVFSGHRDTVFRRLGELEVGDKIIVETSGEAFIYKIKKLRIVDRNDETVLVPKPRETLTITTCYPFRYIGSAPERYVVEAVRLKGI